jgi:hypothetical protein
LKRKSFATLEHYSMFHRMCKNHCKCYISLTMILTHVCESVDITRTMIITHVCESVDVTLTIIITHVCESVDVTLTMIITHVRKY